MLSMGCTTVLKTSLSNEGEAKLREAFGAEDIEA